MTFNDFWDNNLEKINEKCYKCRHLGIASHFVGNVNVYHMCCVKISSNIGETDDNCPFEEVAPDELKKRLEMICAQHGISAPDWIKKIK